MFAKQLKEYCLDSDDQLLLLLFCHLLVNKDDDDIRFSQMEDLFDSKADFNNAKAKLRNGDHKLMKKKLIEHRCEDGIADTSRFRLTGILDSLYNRDIEKAALLRTEMKRK